MALNLSFYWSQHIYFRTKILFCFVWFLLANYYYMFIIYACYQVRSAFGMCIQRELSAIAGAVTISCLMVRFVFILTFSLVWKLINEHTTITVWIKIHCSFSLDPTLSTWRSHCAQLAEFYKLYAWCVNTEKLLKFISLSIHEFLLKLHNNLKK